MTVDTILQVVTLLGIGALGILFKHYLPGYVTEKGKNLATKEDVADITRRIEDVKAKYAQDLEGMRADIHSRLGIHQFRYQREFEILLPLSEKLVEFRNATLSLRPETEYVNLDESEDARKQRKLARYATASRDLYLFSETRRPFIPELLVQALRALDQIAWHEVVQYRHRSPHGQGCDPKYWDNALENSAKIQAATDQVLVAIRDRARLWERFEPGA
ncbi:MAG: hypothetical protein OEV76_11250 [Anaerolineae bacterium]|nr:hypothetical protein [Anaerolineae bacterium]